jgi:hypothetical protein
MRGSLSRVGGLIALFDVGAPLVVMATAAAVALPVLGTVQPAAGVAAKLATVGAAAGEQIVAHARFGVLFGALAWGSLAERRWVGRRRSVGGDRRPY